MEINPGIRRVVLWLNGSGFNTCDSGDGKTHDYGCYRYYPYVVCEVEDPARIVGEARRLRNLLNSHGLVTSPINPGGAGPCIQATYDPDTDTAFIELMFVDDEVMFGA